MNETDIGPDAAPVKKTADHGLAGLCAIAAYFREHDIEAVAVCFLHAYANADNERLVAARLRELMPEAAIVASHEISREWREYERTSTTVLSAYVAPVVERYVGALQGKLGTQGMAGAPYIMQSNGGVATAGSVRRNPITMVESGPAAGIFAAASVGRLIGEPSSYASGCWFGSPPRKFCTAPLSSLSCAPVIRSSTPARLT